VGGRGGGLDWGSSGGCVGLSFVEYLGFNKAAVAMDTDSRSFLNFKNEVVLVLSEPFGFSAAKLSRHVAGKAGWNRRSKVCFKSYQPR
jgi:hypothetical protein